MTSKAWFCGANDENGCTSVQRLVNLRAVDRRVVPKESGLIRARDEVHDWEWSPQPSIVPVVSIVIVVKNVTHILNNGDRSFVQRTGAQAIHMRVLRPPLVLKCGGRRCGVLRENVNAG
jgi:hypothetical protein